MPAEPVLERLASLCLQLLAASGVSWEAGEGEALERLARVVGDSREVNDIGY